ncbi:MAG: patatin-like phospholipase family protein [Candidatus Paceibacterota bacterium]
MTSKPPKNNLKIGLALSGGSALGLFHIGVLQSLEDHDISIDCISGTSAGAIVAACYAFGISTTEIAARAKKISWWNLSSFSYSKMGLANTDAIGKLMEEILGPVNIEDAKIPLTIVATDIKSGERIVFKKGNVSQAVMASVCIPGLFAPVHVGDLLLVDGGLVENLPLLALNDLEPNLKIGVNLTRWRTCKEPTSVIDVMLNTLYIISQKQIISHSQDTEILIEPHLEKYSASDFKKVDELMAEGYRAITLAMPEIKQKIKEETVRILEHQPNLLVKFFKWLKGE